MKINTTEPIYNGYSLRQLINRLNPKMIKSHRKWYLKNCLEVFFNEKHQINLTYNECLRNTNFNLTKFYLNDSKI